MSAPALRLGVVGLGGMGTSYLQRLAKGAAGDCALTAVCSRDARRHARAPEGTPAFVDHRELARSGAVDAVLIATPHPSHAQIAVDALQCGLHVLIEKPLAPDVRAAREIVAAAAARPDRVCGVVLNRRTDPRYSWLRRELRAAALGAVHRVHWTATRWFRPEFYYRSRPWRGTWRGAGGGVLLGQTSHQLDLLQWCFGMPQRVTGFCGFGRHHAVEVEDEAVAVLDYADGLRVVVETSTGEAPGVDRLEVAAEMGRVVIDDDGVRIERNECSARAFAQSSEEWFAAPQAVLEELRFDGDGGQHNAVLENFAAAVRGEAALLAPVADGVASVELANAIVGSAWQGRTLDLPLDAEWFAREVERRRSAAGT